MLKLWDPSPRCTVSHELMGARLVEELRGIS
jgi:hypothetical protein